MTSTSFHISIKTKQTFYNTNENNGKFSFAILFLRFLLKRQRACVHVMFVLRGKFHDSRFFSSFVSFHVFRPFMKYFFRVMSGMLTENAQNKQHSLTSTRSRHLKTMNILIITVQIF